MGHNQRSSGILTTANHFNVRANLGTMHIYQSGKGEEYKSRVSENV